MLLNDWAGPRRVDDRRREEFVLRRVRARRLRIPFGAGTSLDTRCYVGDVASAVLAALDRASAAAGQVFNVGDLTTGTVRDWALAILAAAGSEASLVTVPEDLVPPDLEDTRSIAQHFLVDSRKAATTRSLLTMAQYSCHDSSIVRTISSAMGISTIKLR